MEILKKFKHLSALSGRLLRAKSVLQAWAAVLTAQPTLLTALFQPGASVPGCWAVSEHTTYGV